MHDGRQFIEQAVANGAAAVAAEAPVAGFVDALPVPLVEQPELRFDVGAVAARFTVIPAVIFAMVGVTGTNGKTTTSRLVAQLGRALGKPCGVIGTLGASLDDTVVDTANTTPDPVSCNTSWRNGATRASMPSAWSVLPCPGAGRVNGVEFETAIYTISPRSPGLPRQYGCLRPGQVATFRRPGPAPCGDQPG